MFVSPDDKNKNKNRFQKPNILRRKSKIPSSKVTVAAGNCDSTPSKSFTASISVTETKIPDYGEQESKCKNNKAMQSEKKIKRTSKMIDSNAFGFKLNGIEGCKVEVDSKDDKIPTTLIDSHQEEKVQSSVNLESFLVSNIAGENIALIQNTYESNNADLPGKEKWCFNFINNTPKIVISACEGPQLDGVYVEHKSDIITPMDPTSTEPSISHQGSCILQTGEAPEKETMSVDQFLESSHKFKCDVPYCDKSFISEQKLKKHQNIHNKVYSPRVPRQSTVECPVKKINDDGTEDPCGMIFQIRDDLMKHLNEEHKPDDAVYRCEECGRRFFSASGLRAHGRAHRSRRPRAALACGWPGCGRVFRQPCRLREHARAHTGDKPYPCRHPNCGWSFRTASKLLRHARRHTGERRHACALCGRAFLRREHLRDHARRHQHARAAPARADPECKQTLTNTSSLDMNIKNVHMKKEEHSTEGDNPDTQENLKTDSENYFTVTYMPKSPDLVSGSKAEAEQENVEVSLTACAGAEGRAARTHCTWPLPPRAHAFTQDDYVLEEEAQVEHSEISESNIYTVRSDLFLHGNVLTNDDSEHMAGGAAGAGGALDAELLLAPSVDLAQEELYIDAVDESVFRVFLLSGEELT